MAANRWTEISFVASLLFVGFFFFFFFFAYGSASDEAAEQDAKETSESWVDWASHKITDEVGMRQEENAKAAAAASTEKAGDIAMKTKDAMSSTAASDAAEYSYHKAGEAKEAMKDDKAGEAKDNIANVAGDVKTKMAGGADEATTDGDERAYERAKQKVSESYEGAKEAMSKGERDKYEAAKERASQAAGDVGAKMRDMAQEL